VAHELLVVYHYHKKYIKVTRLNEQLHHQYNFILNFIYKDFIKLKFFFSVNEI